MSNENGKVKVDTLPFYGEASRGGYAVKKEDVCFVQEGFKVAREGVTEGVGLYKDAKESVNHVIETGQAHSSVAYNQVRHKKEYNIFYTCYSHLVERRRESSSQTIINIWDWIGRIDGWSPSWKVSKEAVLLWPGGWCWSSILLS